MQERCPVMLTSRLGEYVGGQDTCFLRGPHTRSKSTSFLWLVGKENNHCVICDTELVQ